MVSLDCTKDGKWMLATCKNYLLLLPTYDGEVSGFSKSLSVKPIPRKLVLHPEDVAFLNIKEIKFSPAKFDDSEKNKENFIVSGV
mmetsp:Transcript_114630/g.171447  ORF Transcript_114630/g.171447 Transcript_114630/m.171447 type:complete len:85 (-) Transcript_114630:55-309(-)